MRSSSVLVVESNRQQAEALAVEARKYRSQVSTCSSFEEAYNEIRFRGPLIVVTHAVIGAFQGVHLAQAAVRANRSARVVIYGSLGDLVLARHVVSTRVFFERQSFLRHTLQRYLTANLPSLDRRDVRVPDRRTTFRGGRRASDIDALWAGASGH
jgi:DNA-binding NtrC family response regulator